LGVTPRTSRQLAIAHRPQLAAHRLLGRHDPEFLEHPLAEIDDPPAHDAVNRRNRPVLDDRRQRGAMFGVQARRLAGRLAVDQAVRAVRIELQHPVADDLQRHPADLRRLRARRSLVDCRQSQQPPRLRPVLRPPRGRPHHRSVKIDPKRNSHGEPPSFATLNHRLSDLKSSAESPAPRLGISPALSLSPSHRRKRAGFFGRAGRDIRRRARAHSCCVSCRVDAPAFRGIHWKCAEFAAKTRDAKKAAKCERKDMKC
jgi:hypothetical protein